nr:MAG: MEKHLA domain-containing protein [Leptolyngbya sp. IPPAS B-1204]
MEVQFHAALTALVSKSSHDRLRPHLLEPIMPQSLPATARLITSINTESLSLLVSPPPLNCLSVNGGSEAFPFGFQLSGAEPELTELRAEVAALRRELSALKQEKTDLEILLEATAEHSDSVEAELHHTAIEALRQSEEWFRTIAEATPVPVMICRVEDSTILYANTAAGVMFGRTAEELLHQRSLEFYHDPNERYRLLEAVKQDGSVQNFELQCKRADGNLFWVAASLRQLTFNQEPTLLTALHDITERKLAEEALKQQVRDMQIEIDHAKRARQVAEIIQTDYFQQLQAEVEQLRYPDEDW